MVCSVKKVCITCVEIFLSVISFVFFIAVLLPGVALIFIPAYIWRLALIAYVKLCRPDFVKIMGGKSPVLAIDDVHGRPLCTIVGM